MKKLSKEDLTTRSGLADSLNESYDTLVKAIESFNEQMEKKWADIDDALGEYNEAIDEANSFNASIAEKIGDFIDEKSDAWREGERGQAYQDWQDQFASIIDEVLLDQPEDVELPDPVLDDFTQPDEEVGS